MMVVIRSVMLTAVLLSTVAVPIGYSDTERPAGPIAIREQSYASVGTVSAHAIRTIEKHKRDAEVPGLHNASAVQPVEWPNSVLVGRAQPSGVLTMDLDVSGSTRFTLIHIGDRRIPFAPEGSKTIKQKHQQLLMSLDSASRFTFVPGAGCTKHCSDRLPDVYEAWISNSVINVGVAFCVRPTNKRGGQVAGNLYGDKVEGVQQIFGVAGAYSERFDKLVFPPVGVLSLSYQPASEAPTNPYYSFIWGLMRLGRINSAEVTFEPIKKVAAAGGKEVLEVSRVVFGAYHRPPILAEARVVANHEHLWKVPGVLFVDGIPQPGQEFILSTGVPWIEVDRRNARAIYGTMAQPTAEGRYIIPCDAEFPPISLALGGGDPRKSKRLAPPSARFSIKPPNDQRLHAGQCYGAFIVSDSGVYVIGDAFLSSFSVNFNFEYGKVTIS